MKSGHYDYLTGYKATTAFMTCQGFQYELGVWYSIPESTTLELCRRGFHFCIHPSGPRAFYPGPSDRVFECEAKDVLVEYVPGARLKCVARHIRLISEIHPSGDGNTGILNAGDHNTGAYNTGNLNAGDHNTGAYNTGNLNTGNANTGNLNTGHYNAGDHNIGDGNTGSYNTGDYNTGYRNTGHRNTGYGNTGDHNTGNYNTGSLNTGAYNTGRRNTGYGNTGHCNTGWGNAADNCADFFCTEEPEARCFNKPTGLTRAEFITTYSTLIGELAQKLVSPEKFDYTAYNALPNWSLHGIKALHEAHRKGRETLALNTNPPGELNLADCPER